MNIIKGNALDVSNFDKDFLREKVDLTPVDEAVAKSIVQSVSLTSVQRITMTLSGAS